MSNWIRKRLKTYLAKRGYDLVKRIDYDDYFVTESESIEKPSQQGLRERTDALKKYIHIGYPKCASTSLQIDFFGKHPQLYHLGSGNAGNSIQYIDKEVSLAIEKDIRFSRSKEYQEDKIKRIFERHFALAEENKQYHAVGISCEHVSFDYLNDIETKEKARRLKNIFGEATIIMVVRHQKDMLMALYREHVRQGYSGTLDEFLSYSYGHRYKNWTSDFDYNHVYDIYAQQFGANNIRVIAFETIKKSVENFLDFIAMGIGVDPLIKSIRNNNVKMSTKALEIKRHLNQRCRHGVDKSAFSPSHLNRFLNHFNNDADKEWYHEGVIDHHLKDQLIRLSTQLESVIDFPEINMEFGSKWEGLFSSYYSEGNKLFQEKTGLNLRMHNYW